MTNAQRITQRMEATGRTRSKDSIYSVVSDEHTVICHTEATLDTWWQSLQPEDKAALYELHLEGALDPPVQVTACKLPPGAMKRPAFVAAMAELVTASRIMIAAREVQNRPEFTDAHL